MNGKKETAMLVARNKSTTDRCLCSGLVTQIHSTTKEKMAIEFYLEKIEPGCSFIQENFETRKSNRAAEKSALEGAIETLKGTPAFLKAEAAAERAAMGKCAGICEEKGKEHAECGACLNGVSVFGYCSTEKNANAPGCDDATKTSSAAALNFIKK